MNNDVYSQFINYDFDKKSENNLVSKTNINTTEESINKKQTFKNKYKKIIKLISIIVYTSEIIRLCRSIDTPHKHFYISLTFISVIIYELYAIHRRITKISYHE